jgi:hypothetical protein
VIVTPPRFSDFANEDIVLDGAKVPIDSILNTEILITGFRLGSSKYQEGRYVTIQFVVDNERRIVFTGSQVVADQVQRYQEHIPFLTTVKKINRYYTLS